jgi:hypothetical protein
MTAIAFGTEFAPWLFDRSILPNWHGSWAMPRKSNPVQATDLQGFKYFGMISDLLERLRSVGTERDKAGNRELFCDQYVSLLLLYFFSPAITSFNALRQATELAKVEKLLGVKRVSSGSLSEAGSVFDPQFVEPIVRELAARAVPLVSGGEAEVLRGLTAVDGSVFPMVTRAAWALWMDSQHRGLKLHLHYSVLEGVPRRATITSAACSETAQLEAMLEPGLLYVTDRGYQNYSLFRRILDAKSSFIARVKDNIAYVVDAERELTTEAREAGVIRDVTIKRLGTSHHKDEIKQVLRLVVVATKDDAGKPIELWLLTDRLDMAAEYVALGYRYRWTIELFFRWFKQILGCKHLISTKQNGVTMQLYVALIASLLIVLWTGLKPNKRTWEMLQYYFTGWATLDELERHLRRQRERQNAADKKQR